MDEKGFRGFILEGRGAPRGLKESSIRSHILVVKDFERFLETKGNSKDFAGASERDVNEFVSELVGKGSVDTETLLGLVRYSRFCRNDEATVALLVLLDSDLLQIMKGSFKEEFGEEVHDKVLGGFIAPALGTPASLIPRSTGDFMKRLESGVGVEETKRFLVKRCPHTSPPEHYSEERELFLASKDIDDYLAKRRLMFIEELEGHMREGTLFYNQRIDSKVIDFVKRSPEVGVGERRGKVIYHTKIPYMTIEYLDDKDPKLKRYHYCHCPLAREAILSGEEVSRNLCYCSGGYCKRPYEIAFARPLKVEVTKSALWGDVTCQFAIEVPEGMLPGA